ncbi:MAG: BMC domain-containing protein [Anaerolineae bacterium]
MQPAIALLEFDSIAIGIRAGDAMVKRAPLDTVYAGTVQPGKYLVLIGGQVASVEESLAAGREWGHLALIDEVFLPAVHPDVVRALAGGRQVSDAEALGIIETSTVAATIGAADAGVKGADVTLLEILLADGLGGKGYALFAGAVADVEAAVEIGVASLADPKQLVAEVVIARFHVEMLENLRADTRFRPRVQPQGPV